jgi:chemotaxis response regulator CheB
MVVEDNALMRAATSGRLREAPDIEVVGFPDSHRIIMGRIPSPGAFAQAR